MANQIPSGYDPVTLNHWLWYQYKCFTSAPSEFQHLFENIIKRVDPRFVKIKPWGDLGDRKTDGLFVIENGGVEVFQVYAPEKMTLAKAKSKINKDLEGAYTFWSDELKSWVFVYNVGHGIAADIVALLQEKKKEYEGVVVDQLDSDQLWEMARELSIQKRAEVLGAPAGYEYLFFASQIAPEEIQDVLEKSWFVVVHDVMSPVNIRDVVTALDPDVPFGAPFYIRPDVGLGWEAAAEYQRLMVKELLEKSWELSPRYAVFSFAPIPLVIQLGFLLSDQAVVNCYQFDRFGKTWRWPDTQLSQEDYQFHVVGLPETTITDEEEMTICVSLSAAITSEQIQDTVGNIAVKVDLSIDNPNRLWLKHPQQLTELGIKFLEILDTALPKLPNCKLIHLFYAGPTGGAVTIGQLINPRMCPPVALYQFSTQQSPPYEHVITLSEDAQS